MKTVQATLNVIINILAFLYLCIFLQFSTSEALPVTTVASKYQNMINNCIYI